MGSQGLAGVESGSPTSALDPHDLAHGVIEGAFSLIFPDPQARLQLGLKAVSRAGHGGMAWYVWTTDRAGAYEIALAPGLPDGMTDGALLTLRYFPDPDEPVFHRFAAIERTTRSSSLFDRTGTPAFALAASLDPGLFCIGSLILAPQRDQRFTLRLYAPDRWIEDLPDAAGEIGRRDVPAAELALPLVDAIVGGIVYLGHAAPASLQIWRRPGFVVHLASDDREPSSPDLLITDWEVEWSGLVLPGRAQGFDSAFAAQRSTQQPWFAHAAATPPLATPWPVNALWWQAAQWRFDPVGMFCGQCAAEEVAGHFHVHTHHCEDAHHDHTA
jgi:hypothetical protein